MSGTLARLVVADRKPTRWSGSGRGKRGGTRVIYYWATDDGVILMLIEVLRRVVEEEFQ